MASSLSIHHPLFLIIISQLHSVTGSAVCCSHILLVLGMCESVCVWSVHRSLRVFFSFFCTLCALVLVFLTPMGLLLKWPAYHVGYIALFFLLHFNDRKIRSVGSRPAFFFAFCLAVVIMCEGACVWTCVSVRVCVHGFVGVLLLCYMVTL